MADKILERENKVLRNSPHVLFVHWTVAISTILLIFSGIGQLPVYQRYMINQIPGLWWSANYQVTLIMHYMAGAALLLAATYHVVFHLVRREYGLLPRRGDLKQSYQIIKAMLTGGKEPPSDKYLAEQRLAYAFIAFWLLVIIITGILKVLKNLPGITLFNGTMVWVTNIHTLATFMLIFGILAHLAAFLFKANRPLLRGMFTGKVDLDYVRHRHPLWYRRMQEKQTSSPGRGRVAGLHRDAMARISLERSGGEFNE
ncbi:MAG: cytochrome b/b6 domain-containing protein [Thermoanaerobacteraceae bacterium]|nr:cytochrome b/b6 domain-containing protein [Thermoanaerobacteraceae bacterium]MBE3587755.1 cytochrome b/b6 domain-containing protein [Thermoanaerobacteraceae bacterium]